MSKKSKFLDVPKFTRDGSYQVHMGPEYMIEHVCGDWVREMGLDLDPDFQRAHVWTRDQQIAYVEYFMRGGKSGRDLYFNHPNWMGGFKGEFVLVDGKQRIEAFRAFLNNEFPIFDSKDLDPDAVQELVDFCVPGGCYYRDFGGKIGMLDNFVVHVNDLKTRAEVLQWYIDMNSGGTIHTSEDIDKVRQLLREETND